MVDFFYAKRRVLNIWCDVFRPAENITLPDTLIGFYRYDVDQKRRKKLHVRPSHDNRPNDPVKRLFERKFQSVTPEDWRNDPFIVCILISLAQRLVRKKQLAKVHFVSQAIRCLTLTCTNKTSRHDFSLQTCPTKRTPISTRQTFRTNFWSASTDRRVLWTM